MGKTAEAVAEGVSIASAAARLAVRNHILMQTIARDEPFQVPAVAPFARETLISLADEQQDAADLTHRQRKKAWGKHSDPHGTHDYRDRDTRNLRKRERQYEGVAKELRRLADDPHVVRGLVEQARDAAWGDVEANLHRRLSVEGMRADVDPDYTMMRNARMQALRLVDLPRLASHRRAVEMRNADLEAAEGNAADPDDVPSTDEAAPHTRADPQDEEQ